VPDQREEAATGAATRTTTPAGAGGADVIREQQCRTWDRFAAGWAKWDALVMKMLAPVAAQMIRVLALRDGTEHLDIASGTGEPGLSVATLIPRGRVALTDLSGGMLAVASAKAATLGLANVETREASADDLPFGDASFDTISCRFGPMFVPDIAAAVAGLRRVLRPGGRMPAAACAQANQWSAGHWAIRASQVHGHLNSELTGRLGP